MQRLNWLFGLSAAMLFVGGACTQPSLPAEERSEIAMAAEKIVREGATGAVMTSEYPTRPLWGDTHLHTSYSFDVYLFGTPTATPDTAYRFAKGEAVISPTTGEVWQLDRPLDFLVVSDHAELLGTTMEVYQNVDGISDSPTGKAMIDVAGGFQNLDLIKSFEYIVNTASGAVEDTTYGLGPADVVRDLHAGDVRKSAWRDIIETADAHDRPGEFTAFIGWEWSSLPMGANLHRVVFTSADASLAGQFLPYSQMESQRPEDLWAWLQATRERTGADFVAIPHNPNLSWGRMFELEDSDGNPIDADYAERRMEWEKVVEVTQVKGDSETARNLSPTDEFADFETYNFVMLPSGPRSTPVKAEYIRTSLMRGLEMEAEIGINPYQFGLIGSTDSHTGLSTASETQFAGKNQKDAIPEIRSNPVGLGAARGWDMGAAGLVAVWAPRNTRQDIFQAFQRREVYATTGTRISLRFFAGSEFDETDLSQEVLPDAVYRNGVPMGGTIMTQNDAPRFLVQAMKDPDGANLDRVQIIKGWVSSDGEAHERVFDVAWSGERQPDAMGRLPVVGNTVDLETGTYSNTIGSAQLERVWIDPEFDPNQRAFYYVRVLEIPTPRYSLHDAIALGIDVEETGRPATIQERAYSSPIWVSPS